MYKPLSGSTLMGMTKKEIIELLRIAERNAEARRETLNQQAKNCQKLHAEARKHLHCTVTENTYQCQFCQYWETRKKEQVNGRYVFSKLPNYCPHCGAEMDEVK